MRPWSRLGCGVLVLGLVGISVRADDPPPVRGEMRLASGQSVRYEVHFDPNSIRQSQVAGQSVVTLTSAGHLLSYDLPDVHLRAQRIAADEVVCVGKGGGNELLVGLDDGRVYRVDPKALALEPARQVTKLPAKPEWLATVTVGGKPHVIAVIGRDRLVKAEPLSYHEAYSEAVDLASGKTYSLPQTTTTGLVDRQGHVWLGADQGEWGGFVARIDPAEGKLERLQSHGRFTRFDRYSWEGVYGFVELRDGQVWAYGGTSHMGSNDGYIARLDAERPHELATFEPPREEGKEPDPNRPFLPISHIVEEPDGHLLVFSYSDIYRTDAALKSWRKVHTMDLSYRWGRPDAVGSYPAVKEVHVLPDAPARLLLSSIGDGLITLDSSLKETRHAQAGMLGIGDADRLAPRADGLLVFPSDNRQRPWKRGPEGWKPVSFAPPFKVHPKDDFGQAVEKAEHEDEWYETTIVFGPDGTPYAVCANNASPGTRTTARFRNGKWEVLGSEVSSLSGDNTFVTSDGELWNAFMRDFRRFHDGQWQRAGELPLVEGAMSKPGEEPQRLSIGWGLKTVGKNGQAWILVDPFYHQLLGLSYGPGVKDPRIFRRQVTENEKDLEVHDGLAWPDGRLLLATSAGLRLHDPTRAEGSVTKAELPSPPRPVSNLARDARGRLWLAGKGLWMIGPDNALVDLSPVPSIGLGPISHVVPDPQHADGVIVAAGARGVVFLQVAP